MQPWKLKFENISRKILWIATKFEALFILRILKTFVRGVDPYYSREYEVLFWGTIFIHITLKYVKHCNDWSVFFHIWCCATIPASSIKTTYASICSIPLLAFCRFLCYHFLNTCSSILTIPTLPFSEYLG